MLTWLLLNIVGFMCFFIAVLLVRARAELIRRSRDQKWLKQALGVA
jgi:threonine/homoserine/homoserine lactone efflux protein